MRTDVRRPCLREGLRQAVAFNKMFNDTKGQALMKLANCLDDVLERSYLLPDC